MQNSGNSEGRCGAARQPCIDPLVAIAGLEHRFGQLFDEQRHAVGALDDLGDGLAGKAGIAGKPLNQCRAVAPAEPVQRQCSDMRLTAPGVLKLGAEGDEEYAPEPTAQTDPTATLAARFRGVRYLI